MAVRVVLVVLSALVVAACSHSTETAGYCGRQLPTPSPGTTAVSTVEIKNGEVVSGFPEGVNHFYVMPHRTPKPVGNGVTGVDPYLPGVPDGRYQASFVIFPVAGRQHHGVRMTVASRTFTLAGPVTCD